MKARLKFKHNITDLKAGIKGGQEVEIEPREFDEVYGENMYFIVGTTIQLPESDFIFDI